MQFDRRDFLATAAVAIMGGVRNLHAGDEKKSPLKILTANPLNAEPRLEHLSNSWLTPNDLLYVRSHAPNPKIDLDSFRLTVDGLVGKPLSLSLAEIQSRFKKTTAFATLTCAGNRRNEHSAVKAVKGVPWGAGAIGNAEWSGALLADVLRAAEPKPSAKHVWLEGLDAIPKSGKTIPFGGSIPIAKAMVATPGLPGGLVCYAMNKQPLTSDHGAPLRSLVPGYIGARSVKWLGKITLSDRPSPNHYLQNAYKLVPNADPKLLAKADPIYEYRINSVICKSLRLGNKRVLFGYALPPGKPGVTISTVEVSADRRTWKKAKLLGPAQALCWRLWTAELPASTKRAWIRATASDSTSQPATVPWNLKGYLFNAWHTVGLSDA